MPKRYLLQPGDKIKARRLCQNVEGTVSVRQNTIAGVRYLVILTDLTIRPIWACEVTHKDGQDIFGA